MQTRQSGCRLSLSGRFVCMCVCVHVWHVQSDCVISCPAPIMQSHRIGTGQTSQVSVLAWNVWNARQHDVIPQSLGDTVLASCELGMWVHSDMSARMPSGAEHARHLCPGQATGTTSPQHHPQTSPLSWSSVFNMYCLNWRWPIDLTVPTHVGPVTTGLKSSSSYERA